MTASNHGPGDPTTRVDRSGAVWRALRTPEGTATVKVPGATVDGALEISAWGDGAGWALDHAPGLLGADDDVTGFVPRHASLARAWRRGRHLRLGRTSLVMEALLPAVLAAGTPSAERGRAFREIVVARGEPAPGPAPAGLLVQPDPLRLVGVPEWEWALLGIDAARARTLTRLGILAPTLAAACDVEDVAEQRTAVRRLLAVPGIGPSVQTQVLGEATGDPDALDLTAGDRVRWLGHQLTGRTLDAAELERELEPYRGHRLRVLRLLRLHGNADRAPSWLPRPRARS